jgi:uncharacterized protein YjbJ (UPF0337 family)
MIWFQPHPKPDGVPECEPGNIALLARCDTGIITLEHTMNWDQIEGNWKQFKGKVRQQWGKLTDDDLDVIKGNQTELAGRLQERYGYAKDEAKRQIDTWMKTVN